MKVAVGTTKALLHLHKAGVVHGNLKPANILLHDDGEPSLSDYGLSRLLAQDSDAAIGNDLSYRDPRASPQVGVTFESDVYNYGMILFGAPPVSWFLTVKETLRFGARLRLPELSNAELDAGVGDTAEKMGLEECADTTIGNWHLRGISGGERRRLSIAVELLAQTRVLCLDEATTGLDSADAFFVVEALRNVARDGGDERIVVCFPQVSFSKK